MIMERGFGAIYWRDMVKFFRYKAMLLLSILQPALWLGFYGLSMSGNVGALYTGAGPDTATVNYMTFITSGVIGMTILFSCLYAGQNLQFDKQYGLMKQVVVSPLPRSQILIGTTLSGITKCLIQTLIIVLVGHLLGARFFAGFSFAVAVLSAVGFLLFVVLFSTGLTFLSNTIGLKVTNHDVSQALMVLLTLPLFFASNALYPLETLPPVLRALCHVNPLTYFINGVRYFTIGPQFHAFGFNYALDPQGLLLALGFLLLFTLVTFFFAARVFRNVVEF